MTQYNHKLLTQIDKFFKLAQELDDDLGDEVDETDETEEERRAKLEQKRQDLRRQLRELNKILGPSPGTAPQQPKQPTQTEQPAQPTQQGPEAIVLKSLTDDFYSNLQSQGNGVYRGIFNGERAGKVIQLLEKNLLNEGNVKKWAAQDKLRFNVSVSVGSNLATTVNLTSTNANYDKQYAQYFNTAKQQINAFLSPMLINGMKGDLQMNNMKPEIGKPFTINTWFIVSPNGQLTQMS